MRRPPILRPTRSSARFFRFRVGFSDVMPWCTGLPYTIPCRQRPAAGQSCSVVAAEQALCWLRGLCCYASPRTDMAQA